MFPVMGRANRSVGVFSVSCAYVCLFVCVRPSSRTFRLVLSVNSVCVYVCVCVRACVSK